MPNNHNEIEKRLWSAADELRANSKLKSSEYSVPVLGLIFLRYADHKFTIAQKELAGKSTSRRPVGKTDYQARGVLYLPEASRFSKLLNLPEGADIGKAINEAMRAIEAENEELKDIMPKTYNHLDNSTLVELLKTFNSVPMDIEGEFFTPTSIVKLIVEVIEPYHGRIFDPACGSGGMFVQSARFVENHKENPNAEISIYGQEKTAETVRLCKMNLAVHGLSGDIREGNSYYEDIHKSVGKFDFVMANSASDARGSEQPETTNGSAPMMTERFPEGKYVDVPGLCKVAALSEIEAQGWSLNPGHYVGVAESEADDFDFRERLEELNEELETLNVEARELEGRIVENVEKLLEAG